MNLGQLRAAANLANIDKTVHTAVRLHTSCVAQMEAACREPGGPTVTNVAGVVRIGPGVLMSWKEVPVVTDNSVGATNVRFQSAVPGRDVTVPL